jgi:circadian clock protein KaiC
MLEDVSPPAEDLEVLESEPLPSKKERVETGIEGFDKLIEGGFKTNSSNILIGGPGSGKSIFSMQFLVEGIDKQNENGVFISFERTEEQIISDFSRFDWKIEEKIHKKQLVILNYTPEQIEKVLEMGGGILKDTISSVNAKRVVIDSISAFLKLFDSSSSERHAFFILIETLYKWGGTVLFTVERDFGNGSSSSVDFMADGIIAINNKKIDTHRERFIEVIKMRGTKHSTKESPLQITEKGIIVYE